MKRASFALLVIGWTMAVGASPCLDYARQEFKKYLPPTDPVFTDAFYAQVEPIVKRALAKAEVYDAALKLLEVGFRRAE